MLIYLSFASALPIGIPPSLSLSRLARCLLHTEKKKGGRMDITYELAEGGEGSLDQIKTTTKDLFQYIPSFFITIFLNLCECQGVRQEKKIGQCQKLNVRESN